MSKLCYLYYLNMILIAFLFHGNRLHAQQEIWKHYPAFYMVNFHSSGKLNVLVSTSRILVLDSTCQNIIRSIEYTKEDFEDLSYKKMKSVSDGSIFILGKKKIYKINETSFDSIALPKENTFSRFLVEEDGTIWIGAYAELNIYKDGKWYPVRPEIKDQFLKIVNDYNFQDIKKDRKGNLWFSTNYGLTKYDGTNYFSYSTRFGYLKGLNVYDFDFDTMNVLYVINGYDNIGLVLSIIDSMHTVHIPDMQNTRVMVDKENYVWFGPDRPGYLDNKTKVDYIETGSVSGFHLDIHGNLNYLLDNHNIVQVSNSGIRKVDFNQFGFITNGAQGLCIDSFGTKWIYNSQLRKLDFDFTSDSIIQFKEGNDGFRISSIIIDEKNQFWIAGDYQKNILRFNPYKNETKYYPLPNDELYRLIPNSFRKILLYNSSGIFEIKDTLIHQVDLNACAIPERGISTVVMNSSGDLYILSYDNLKLKKAHDCTEYPFPSFKKNSFVHSLRSMILKNDEVYLVMHLHDTIDGNAEYILVNFKNGEFHEVNFLPGDQFVNSMILDLNDNLWIANRESVYKIDPSGKVTDYGAKFEPFLRSVSKIEVDKDNHKYFISWSGVSELIEEEITSTTASKKSLFQIYPNPSTGKVFIKHDEKIEFLEIYNSNGSLVNRISNPGPEIEIDNQGFYYVKAYAGKNIEGQKLIILHK